MTDMLKGLIALLILVLCAVFLFLCALFVSVAICMFIGIKSEAGYLCLATVLFVGAIVAIAKKYAQKEKRKAEAERLRQLELEEKQKRSDDAYSEWCKYHRLVPFTDTGISVQPGEMLFFRESNVELYEAATQTMAQTSGTISTMTMQYDSDLSGTVGGFDATTVHQQWEEKRFKAKGTLYLTNRRMAFVSDMQTRNIPWQSVLSCSAVERYWFCVCASGMDVAQNFYAVGARIYSEAGRLLQDATVRSSENDVHHTKPCVRTGYVACPYCGEEMMLPEDVVDGQHILCPTCSRKFTLGE